MHLTFSHISYLLLKVTRKFSFLLFLSQPGSSYVAHADLELEIFLPPSPEGWDYRLAPPCPAHMNYQTRKQNLEENDL
jgi:hypothetical protein